MLNEGRQLQNILLNKKTRCIKLKKKPHKKEKTNTKKM